MKDILGRELKENDLVIGMIISRGSDGMRHGIFNGTSVHWNKYNDYITTSTMTNVYLVENPCPKELEIKEKILEILEKNRIATEKAEMAKKLLVRIPTKDLVIGKVYVTDGNMPYVYLGKGKLYDGYKNETKEGFIYMYPGNRYNAEKDYFFYPPSFDVLKNPRKMVKESDKEYPYDFTTKKKFIIKKEEPRNYGYGYHTYNAKAITITLEGYKEE